MSLQRFEAPVQVNDLGAGIAAGALLLGRGLGGFLMSRPARLSLQPLDGSSGATIDVPIEAARDVALLSKDLAVVLGADGLLWSLQGLGEGAKPRQIALDIRALCARPHGESALAVGADGGVRAVTASGGAAAIKALSVRGAVRACDLGEHVCYAVVDDEAGAQLRIHPGATPELGAKARVALPEGAAGLDRVCGGRLLSALYKRGDATVCVVQGEGKLEAKLLQLEAKVADVTVLGDCLLVAFADRRLSLYDGGAIARAREGAPVEATNAIALGANGVPRVILAVAGKGGPALWVGTSAGEVLRVPMVEGAAEAAPLSATSAAAAAPNASEAAPADAAAPAAAALEAVAAPDPRERELTELRAKIERMTSEHATALEGMSAHLAALREELLARTMERDHLQTELRTTAEELQTRTIDLERVTSDLSAEREKAHKEWPFGDDLRISVEHAWEKIEPAVTLIQGILFKRPRDR